MQLFYTPDISETTTEFSFSKEESKHLVKVLRKKEGDTIHITNGKGYLFEAILIATDTKHCIVTINKVTLQAPKKYSLHLVVAPTKMNDRYEWFLEKATEIGIDEITPIICSRSERKVIKIERCNRILLSAMKQSLKFHLPKINEAITLNNFLKKDYEGAKYITHCEDGEKKELKTENKTDKYLILIGPEGDFSTAEIEIALQNQFKAVSLGTSRLRTETAGIVAVHTINYK